MFKGPQCGPFFSRRREKETIVYLKDNSIHNTIRGNNFHCTTTLGNFYISPANPLIAGARGQQQTNRRCIVMIYPSNVGHYVLSGWEDRQ